MSLLQLTRKDNADGSILSLKGRFSVQDTRLFRDELDALIEDTTGSIFLNCAELLFVSSSAISALVGATLKMNEQSRFLGLYDLKSNISDIFSMTGVDSVIRIHEDYAAILEASRKTG